MVRATFDIIPGSIPPEELQQHLLLMEVGEQLFSYALYNKNRQRFEGYRQYNLDFIPGKPAMETLQEILVADEYLQSSFREAYLIYHFTDSNLVPEKHFHIELNKPVTELVYGNAHKGLLLSEKVPGWNLYNVYRMPREVHTLLQKKFAAGKYWHYYTMTLSGLKAAEIEQNQIQLIFAADRFMAGVFTPKGLQLLQTYLYETPEDVSYHLLAICQQFGFDQEAVLFKVAGLIDEQSILYQELLKYFTQLQWDVLPDGIALTEQFGEYPVHYFSPLLKMALCV